MSQTFSTNGHIEVDQSDFNEFSFGTFRIIKSGKLDGKTAGSVIIYDTDEYNRTVQIRSLPDNIIRNNARSITVDNDLLFKIEPQLVPGAAAPTLYNRYSFGINVMDANAPRPIIDSLVVTGNVTEAFVSPLTYTTVNNADGSYTFLFAANTSDGPADKILGYRIKSMEPNFRLTNSSGINVGVGSVVTTVNAIKADGFDGRIKFTVALVDINGKERKSQVSVVQFDSKLALPPVVGYVGFQSVPLGTSFFQSIYESTNDSKLNSGTIKFRLSDQMFDDGKFTLNWSLTSGRGIAIINDLSNNYSGNVPLRGDRVSDIKISSMTGKFGALVLDCVILYNGTMLETTKKTLHLNILPATDANLVAYPKRVYMMNYHQYNINDTVNGYDLIQPQIGVFKSTAPNEMPVDELNDGNAVFSLIANKTNPGRKLCMNITKYDTYAYRTQYDHNDGTVRLLLETLRINVVNSNGKKLALRTNKNNITAIGSNMSSNGESETAVSAEQAKWTEDSSLNPTDVIVDPYTNGFAGQVNVSYQLIDTLGNISNIATVSFFICAYSKIRVTNIVGDKSLLLLKDVPQRISVTFENSVADEPNYSLSFPPKIKLYVDKLTRGNIDFPRMVLNSFKIDGVANDNTKSNLLRFNSIVDNGLRKTYSAPVYVRRILLGNSVVLNYDLYAVNAGVYTFNFVVPTNTSSISGNSVQLNLKPVTDPFLVRMYVNDTEYFNTLVSHGLETDIVTITDTLDAGSLKVTQNSITATVPVSITYDGQNPSLKVDGTTKLHILETDRLLVLENAVVSGDLAVNKIIASGPVEISNDLIVSNIEAKSITLAEDGEIKCSLLETKKIETQELNVTGNLSVFNGKTIVDVLEATSLTVVENIVAGSVEVENLNASGDIETIGNIKVNDINANGTIHGSDVVSQELHISDLAKLGTLEVTSDSSFGGDLLVSGSASVGNGMNVTGTLNATEVVIDTTLEVIGSTMTDIMTANALYVNYNAQINAELRVNNDEFRITEEEGVVSNMPVTIGSGTTDVVLTVNGSVLNYGDFSMNDNQFVLSNNKATFGVNVNMEENSLELGEYSVNGSDNSLNVAHNGEQVLSVADNDVEIKFNLYVEKDAEITGNVVVEENLSVSGNVSAYNVVVNADVSADTMNVSSNLAVEGSANLNSLDVTGLSTLNGDLHIGGDLEIRKVYNVQSSTINVPNESSGLISSLTEGDGNSAFDYLFYNMIIKDNNAVDIISESGPSEGYPGGALFVTVQNPQYVGSNVDVGYSSSAGVVSDSIQIPAGNSASFTRKSSYDYNGKIYFNYNFVGLNKYSSNL